MVGTSCRERERERRERERVFCDVHRINKVDMERKRDAAAQRMPCAVSLVVDSRGNASLLSSMEGAQKGRRQIVEIISTAFLSVSLNYYSGLHALAGFFFLFLE